MPEIRRSLSATARPPAALADAASPSPVRGMWNRLRNLFAGVRRAYVDPQVIGDTHPASVKCPLLNVVRVVVRMGNGQHATPIHANTITFANPRNRTSPLAKEHAACRTAIAGRSPKTFAQCEKFLAQGLASGRGLFQFVSPRANHFSHHKSGRSGSVTPIIDQLRCTWRDHDEAAGPLVLAGRYSVVAFDEIPVDADDHYCYQLTVQDLDDGNKVLSVPLTQVGLKFDQRVLQPEHIERANTLLDQHRTRLDPDGVATDLPDPMIVSTGGIGRNATLITYRQVRARMDAGLTGAGLDGALEFVAFEGRRDRGDHFIHSEMQLQALRDALVRNMDQRARPGLPRSSACPHPAIARMRVSFVEAHHAQPAATSLVSPTPVAASPRPVSDVVQARKASIALVESHLADSPLQFHAAIAEADPEVAAFLAVQEQRMTTSEKENYCDPYHRSLHAGVGVNKTAFRAAEKPGICTIDDAIPSGPNRHPCSVTRTTVLRRDLQLAMARPGSLQGPTGTAHDSIFPNGMADALQVGRLDQDSGERHALLPVLDPPSVGAFLQRQRLSPLTMIEQLAVHHPAIAAFVHLVDNALLFADAGKDRPVERYPYLNAANATRILHGKVEETGNAFLPTFLDGVHYRFERDDTVKGDWQVVIDGQLQTVHDKQQVLHHVFTQAMAQLQSSDAQVPTAPAYPLAVYMLLGKAFGLPVPAPLIEREQAMLTTLENNRTWHSNRAQEVQQALQAARSEREAAEKAKEVADQERFRTEDVTNEEQLKFCGVYTRDLTHQSFDVIIPMQSDHSASDALTGVHEGLAMTHYKQEISARYHQSFVNDNLCWLRSSWLPLFAALTPDELVARLDAITLPEKKKDIFVEKFAPVLHAIASLYRQDPAAFMHGLQPAASEGSSPVDTLADRASPARLGPALRWSEALKNFLPNDFYASAKSQTIESFLKQLQLKIAAAYREKGSTGVRTLMSEIQSLSGPGGIYAVSDIPVTLHRAFNVPVLVIECQSYTRGDGVQRITNREGQLRIAAPNDSALAQILPALASSDAAVPAPDTIQQVMNEFKNRSVIWLERDLYDLYVPR